MTKITPNLENIMAENDSASIQRAINYAHETGVNSVTIPRINERTGEALWTIERAIILPSDMEIVLDNCHLRQADGCFDNMFRSFEDVETQGHTNAEQKRNIIIRGQGNAVLDGGLHNGLTQKTAWTDGLPSVTRNNLILLYNVRDFVLEKFEVRNQRYWAFDLIHAQRGRISEIYINGECDCRNQDGIDLRVGCSDIIIEKITGQTGDDIVALSAIGNNKLPRGLNNMYRVEGRDEDIHDIIIRDIIATSVECSVIGLRNCDGRKIYNITIDNIHCTDNYAEADGKTYPEYPKFKLFKPEFSQLHRVYKGNIPYTLLRIGQHGYFGDRDAVLGEMYNIHATNLHMYKGSVIVANVALENCYFGNIYAENDVDYILTTKDIRITKPCGAQMKNVIIENVFYKNTDNAHATAFDIVTDEEHKEYKVENLFVNKAFLGNCKNIFNLSCAGEIKYSGVYGSYVQTENGSIGSDV